MKTLLCILFAISMIGCADYPNQIKNSASKQTKNTRVTYYCAGEDRKWRSKTASGGRIVPFRTVAARRAVPFGRIIRIPYLAHLFPSLFKGDFVVDDRGTAVESRKAARKMGLDCDVIDVAVPDKKTVRLLASVVPPVLPVDM